MTTTPGAELDLALARFALAGELAATSARLAALADQVAALTARVDALEADPDTDPTPDPPPPPKPPVEVWRDTDLWTGPTWTGPFPTDLIRLYQPATGLTPWRTPSVKATAEAARVIPSGQGGIDITLTPADMTKPHALASTIHEGWLPFDRRYHDAGFETDLLLPTGWAWPRTMKWGGIVGWDGDWPTWPGGGRPTGRNASVRLTGNDYDRNGNPRLAAYLYLGGVWNGDVELWGTDRANWVSNDGHTVEILLDEYGVPPIGEWITARFDVACDADGFGSLTVEMDGELALVVQGLRWFTDPTAVGWNLGYLCAGFGGDTPDFLPTSAPPWHLHTRRARWYRREVVG